MLDSTAMPEKNPEGSSTPSEPLLKNSEPAAKKNRLRIRKIEKETDGKWAYFGLIEYHPKSQAQD